MSERERERAERNAGHVSLRWRTLSATDSVLWRRVAAAAAAAVTSDARQTHVVDKEDVDPRIDATVETGQQHRDRHHVPCNTRMTGIQAQQPGTQSESRLRYTWMLYNYIVIIWNHPRFHHEMRIVITVVIFTRVVSPHSGKCTPPQRALGSQTMCSALIQCLSRGDLEHT